MKLHLNVALTSLIFAAGTLTAQLPSPGAPSSAKPGAAAKTKPVTQNVGIEAFDQLRKGTNIVVLDVRTPREFAQGHLPGAVLLDYRSANFADQVAKLDKSKQYLVHCAAGGRSAQACEKMEALGFTNLVNLEGGLNAWKKAGKPLEE